MYLSYPLFIFNVLTFLKHCLCSNMYLFDNFVRNINLLNGNLPVLRTYYFSSLCHKHHLYMMSIIFPLCVCLSVCLYVSCLSRLLTTSLLGTFFSCLSQYICALIIEMYNFTLCIVTFKLTFDYYVLYRNWIYITKYF